MHLPSIIPFPRLHRTVGRMTTKSTHVCSSVCSLAHSFACSHHSRAPLRSFDCSLAYSWKSSQRVGIQCVNFMQFQPTVRNLTGSGGDKRDWFSRRRLSISNHRRWHQNSHSASSPIIALLSIRRHDSQSRVMEVARVDNSSSVVRLNNAFPGCGSGCGRRCRCCSRRRRRCGCSRGCGEGGDANEASVFVSHNAHQLGLRGRWQQRALLLLLLLLWRENRLLLHDSKNLGFSQRKIGWRV